VSIAVGASDGAGFEPIEKAYGKPLERRRVYTTLEDGWPAGWQALSQVYGLDWSVKLCDHNRKPYPATDVWPGRKHDDQLIAILQGAAKLTHRPQDPHKGTAEHEEDAKAAAGSGTYPQLNDASLHVAELAYATSGYAANGLWGTCWTGYDLAHREPQLRPTLAPAEFIAVDPYLSPGQKWATFDQLVGPELDYLSAHEPNLRQCIWEFGCDPRSGRVEWLEGIPAAIKGNPKRYGRLEGLDYWNAGAYSLDPTGLSTLAAAYQALKG
jgi:hypothetical protein